MSIEIKQHLKLSQQLVMTPQLQQAIKLLQLSRMELVDLVREEMMENPVLEDDVEVGAEGKEPDLRTLEGDDLSARQVEQAGTPELPVPEAGTLEQPAAEVKPDETAVNE